MNPFRGVPDEGTVRPGSMDESLKERVLAATDIVEVVGEQVSLTRRGKDFVGLCPFHPDHKPSLAVSPTKRIFKCWSCGAGGDVIRFVQLRERVDFPQALRILAQRAGLELHASDSRNARLRERLRECLSWARAFFQRQLLNEPGGLAARAYARSRGLSEQTLRDHGIGYAPDSWDALLRAGRQAGLTDESLIRSGLVVVHERGRLYDRFRHRLMFPIHDAVGRPIAFGGRTLGDDPAKYLNSPESPLFNKSRVLYGLDRARRAIEQTGQAIVVEGYMDAVLLHQYGFTHTVATLGTAFTPAHARLLGAAVGQVVLLFDGDEAGLRAAERAIEAAIGYRTDIRVARTPVGQDPADCVVTGGAEALRAVLQSACDALEFKWQQVIARSGTGDPRTRRAAIEEFVRFVSRCGASGGMDILEQGSLVARLSELVSLPPSAIYELLARLRRPGFAEAGRVTSGAARWSTSSAQRSDYQNSLKGVPRGLVVAVESLFGCLLSNTALYGPVVPLLESVRGFCEVWDRLHRVVLSLAQQGPGFTRADVLARCEEPAVCELVNHACQAVPWPATLEDVERLGDRIRLEVDALRISDLRQSLTEQDGAPQDARVREAEGNEQRWRSLLEAATRHHGVLSPHDRWRAMGSA